jgi:hypothetical protein
LAGPSPEFRLQTVHESLAAFQQAIEAARGQQPPADLAMLAAAAPAFELDEVLIQVPAGPQANYVTSIQYEYAPGTMREVRPLLEEFIQRRTADGGRFALMSRVSGGAPAFSVAGLYQNLAELEASRSKNIADPASGEWIRRLSAFLARPADLPEIGRIVARSAA